jgi:CheY-like chemotaxis protein
MDGLALAEQIGANPATRGTVLLMLTSLDDALDAESRHRYGLAGCLLKPLRQSRLLDALTDAVATHYEPQETDRREAPPVAAMRGSSPRGEAARILVADDNEINRLVAAEMLRSAGYAADAVANGREAIAAVGRERYAFVLMDCEMPEVDGFTATDAIRRRERDESLPRLPIVALTAKAVEGDRERCLEAGMDEYITKPVDRERLMALAGQFCGEAATPPEVERRLSASPPRQEEKSSPLDIAQLLDRCSGDSAFMRQILGKFQLQLDENLVQLASALNDEDLAQVARLAHALKGAAGNISASAISRTASELERKVREEPAEELLRFVHELREEAQRFAKSLQEVPGNTGDSCIPEN